MKLEDVLQTNEAAMQQVGWSSVKVFKKYDRYRVIATLGTGGHRHEFGLRKLSELAAWLRADGLVVADDEWGPV